MTQLPLASGQVTLPDRVPDANPRTEVGQVGAAFNRMLGHVEAALARRAATEARLRRFAADASHELRTPLAAIRGYAELALRHPGPVPADIEHALRRVEAESARMSVLVDELLLLAQLDAGRPLAQRTRRPDPAGHRRHQRRPRRRPHPPLAARTARRAGPGPRRRTPPAPGAGQPDEQRRQAHPTRHHRHRRADHPGPGAGRARVELSVTDDGPGIPAELQPTLFERFVRGDTSRSPRRPARQHRPRPGHRGRGHHRARRHGPPRQPTRPHPLRHHAAPARRPGTGRAPAFIAAAETGHRPGPAGPATVRRTHPRSTFPPRRLAPADRAAATVTGPALAFGKGAVSPGRKGPLR